MTVQSLRWTMPWPLAWRPSGSMLGLAKGILAERHGKYGQDKEFQHKCSNPDENSYLTEELFPFQEGNRAVAEMYLLCWILH